jgi:hypothetical protein
MYSRNIVSVTQIENTIAATTYILETPYFIEPKRSLTILKGLNIHSDNIISSNPRSSTWPPSSMFYIALCSLIDGEVHDITLRQLTLINLLFKTKSVNYNRKYQIFID